MTEKEALAIFGCKTRNELEEKKEELIFSIKQKFLTKSYHPKVFNKFLIEINRYKSAYHSIALETINYSINKSSTTNLIDSDPISLISSFLTEKQSLFLKISNASSFVILETHCIALIDFYEKCYLTWKKYIHQKSEELTLRTVAIEDMEWVKFKHNLIRLEIKIWDDLITHQNSTTEIRSMINQLAEYINYLSK